MEMTPVNERFNEKKKISRCFVLNKIVMSLHLLFSCSKN
uniref:Uncharacterized protein n=1 Tax=Rhizophora mucronata TaxID=61149 RepID=A0A2P2QXZ0_RHIMU